MSDNAFDTSTKSTSLEDGHKGLRPIPQVLEPCPDDPAIVIGLATQFSRLGLRGDPIPAPVLRRLRALAGEGVPSARFMYWEIVKRGKAPYVALASNGRQPRAVPTRSGAPLGGGER